MGNRSCFFIGHRDSPEELYPALLAQIQNLIVDYNVTDFYVGHYGSFDAMTRRALAFLKPEFPHIRRILVTPYHPAQQPMEKPEDFEELLYPCEEPVMLRCAMIKVNRQMIDTCDYVVAHARDTGREWDFFEYAKRRERKGLVRVLTVHPGWEAYMRHELSVYLTEACCELPRFDFRNRDELLRAGERGEEALLNFCHREIGGCLPDVLKRVEALAWKDINNLRVGGNMGGWQYIASTQEFLVYFAQLRKRAKL